MLGSLDARVESGGPVVIGPSARWKGDCRAPSLDISAGARIEAGEFAVPHVGFRPTEEILAARGPSQRASPRPMESPDSSIA